MRIEFKNPVATVFVVWAVERTVKHIITSLTMPEFDRAMALVKSKGFDIVPKKTEEEDLEKIDPEVVEDLPDEIDISDVEEKEEK